MAEVGSGSRKPMDFVPMRRIEKTSDDWDARCTDWVATEKVHGSSFQMFTDDGATLHVGSRRRNLDHEESFLKCNVQQFLAEHRDYVIKFWQAIVSDDRWSRHRDRPPTIARIGQSHDDDDNDDDDDDSENVNDTDGNNTKSRNTNSSSGGSGSGSGSGSSGSGSSDSSRSEHRETTSTSSKITNGTTSPSTMVIGNHGSCSQQNTTDKPPIEQQASIHCFQNTASEDTRKRILVQHNTTTISISNIITNQCTGSLEENDVIESPQNTVPVVCIDEGNNFNYDKKKERCNSKSRAKRWEESSNSSIDNLKSNSDDKNELHSNTAVCQPVSKSDNEKFHLRIYGELYGGGGVAADTNKAIQKEILYSDNFRFYVFGATINRRWLTIAELGDLCRTSGFPYYAKAVNYGVTGKMGAGEAKGAPPMRTAEEMKQWLDESGLMYSRSALTDRLDGHKTRVEGFVLTPLTKPDFGLHAIKYLAPDFNDVRTEQRTNKKTKTIYCTKQRYNSVMSKLEEKERRDKELVIRMMVQDIEMESRQETVPSNKTQMKVWRKMVTQWLIEDGYWTREEEEAEKKTKRKKAAEEEKEEGKRNEEKVVDG